MAKLICGVMGQDCMRFLPMCLESIKSADKIVYIDGGSMDNSIIYAREKGAEVIINNYNQEDKGMNGKQRNKFLSYIKEKYPEDWCLFLDADEVVDDLDKLKSFIMTAEKEVYSVHMRHFIGDLGHEDSTVEEHFVPNRLFKISGADYYHEVEHPVLMPKSQTAEAKTKATTIWHLAYIPNMFEILKRYDNHLKKSNIHTPEYLKSWYYSHLFGQYPKKQINLTDIPKIILDEFGVNKDEFYFANRGIEIKHPIMVKQFYEYFKPLNVLDLGCGRGPYLLFWKWFVKNCEGIELSEWAVKNAFTTDILQGDISDSTNYLDYDLITAIDVLEHLNDKQLSRTLMNMARHGNKFIFSIPFIGDPNLENDKTHKQFRTKEQWKDLISSYGIKVSDAPTEWLFSNQILIGKKE